MPRDLPIGNGTLLVNCDGRYNLRDLYYPHIGQENHTAGERNRFGDRVDGQFDWLDGDDWRRDLRYADETLVTRVTCISDRLGLELLCNDCVDIGRDVYLKRVEVRDRADRARQVRLFQHIDPTFGETRSAMPSSTSRTTRPSLPSKVVATPGWRRGPVRLMA